MNKIILLKEISAEFNKNSGEIIKETELDLIIHDNLIINDKHYIVSRINEDRNLYGVREFDPVNVDRVLDTDLICPYCGDIKDNADDCKSGDIMRCGNCGAIMNINRIIKIEYEAELAEKPNIIDMDKER